MNPQASLADYHTHNSLCGHAEGKPIDYAKAAQTAGLAEVGFSDHSPMPMYFDDWRMLDEELPTYLSWVEEARESLPDFPIKLGLEVDYFENGHRWIELLAGRADWDYFIGAVHYLGDWDVDNPAKIRRFLDQPVDDVWALYWKLFAQAARSGLFHFMAHPDLVKKFGHRPTGDLRRYYEPAVQAVVDAGVAIEINTAGLYKEAAEMYPAAEFLQLAATANVPLVISSDAHEPGHVGRSFEKASALARECGFTHTARFSRGVRKLVPLI